MASQRKDSFWNKRKNHHPLNKNRLDNESLNAFDKARVLLMQDETKRSIESVIIKNLDKTDNKDQTESINTNVIDLNTEASINELIKKYPNNADCCWLFGMFCAHQYKYGVLDKKRQKKYEKAVKCYDKCLRLNPDHADCYCSYGILLVESNKFGKSDQMFKKCFHIDSRNHRGNYHYAECLRLNGSNKYAETFYKAAIEHCNNNSNYHVGYGEFLGMFKHRHQDAENQFLKAIAMDPNNDYSYYFYAQLLKKSGKITFAIANANTANELNPNMKEYQKLVDLLKSIQDMQCNSLSMSSSHSETTATTNSDSKNNLNEQESKEFANNLNVPQIPPIIKHDYSVQNAPGKMEKSESKEYEIKNVDYNNCDICEIEFKRLLNEKIKLNKYYPDLYQRFEKVQCNSIRFVEDFNEQFLEEQIKMQSMHCKEFCRKVNTFKSEVKKFRECFTNVISDWQQFPVDSLIEQFGDNGIWTHGSFNRYILNKHDLKQVLGEKYCRYNLENLIWDAMNGTEGTDDMVSMLKDYAFPTLDNRFTIKEMNNPLKEYHDIIVNYFKKENVHINWFSSIAKQDFVNNLCTLIGKDSDTNYKSAFNQLYVIINCKKELDAGNSKEREGGVYCDEYILSFKVNLQEIINESDINVRNQAVEIKKMVDNDDPNNNIMTCPRWSNGQYANDSFNQSHVAINNNQNGSNKDKPDKPNRNNNNNNGNNNSNNGGNGGNNYYQLYHNQKICNRPECVLNRTLLMQTNQQLQQKQNEMAQLCQYIQRLLEENVACKNAIRQLIHDQYTSTPKVTLKRRKSSTAAATINKRTGDGSSYEPNGLLRAKKNVKIERALTSRFIPTRIKHKINDLNGNSMVFKYIDKSLAMINYDDNIFMNDDSKYDYDEVILDFDFIDKINKEPLYCKMFKKSKGGFKWEMMNNLLTKKDIGHNILLYSPRKSNSFLSQLQNSDFITQCLTQKIIQQTKWHKINVFNDKNNKKQMTLSLTKEAFIKRVKQILFCGNKNIDLIPIVIFNNNGYSIQHLLIVYGIDINVDIGISFNINTDTFLVEATGIHLNKSYIYEQHILAQPNHECHCLDSFKSNINILKIGNVNDDENARKSSEKKYKDLKDFLYKFIDSVPTDYQSLKQIGQSLINNDNGKPDQYFMVNIDGSLTTNDNDIIAVNDTTPYLR